MTISTEPSIADAARAALAAIDTLVAQSHGVAGLHLNGDVAPWDELQAGGRFEEWLRPLEALRAALAAPVVNKIPWPEHAAQWHREQAVREMPLPIRKDGSPAVHAADIESLMRLRERQREWHTIQAYKLSRMASDFPSLEADSAWFPMSTAPKGPLDSLGQGPEIILLGGFAEGTTAEPSVRTGYWKGLRTNAWCDTALGRCPRQPIAWTPKPTAPADPDTLFDHME